MLFLILWAAALSGAPAYFAAYKNKRFEEGFTPALFGIVLWVYTFGLFGFMRWGVYSACSVCFGLWAAALYKIIKEKSFKNFILNMLTLYSVFLAAVCCVFIYGMIGMQAYQWDEFSHWASSVKIMYYNDDFCSNPALNAQFQSYPPAMSIFQYFLLVIKGEFADWVLYFGYMLFSVGIFGIFFRKLKHKNILKNTLMMFFLICVIIVCEKEAFVNLQIDLFLGLMFGFIAAYFICFDCIENTFNKTVFSMSAAVLVLAKDAGLLFALLAVIMYGALYLLSYRHRIKNITLKNALLDLMPLIALLFAKISWEINMAVNHTYKSFGGEYDFVDFINVLLGRGEAYRVQVRDNFLKALFNYDKTYANFISLDYGFVVLLLLLAVCAAGASVIKSHKIKNTIAASVLSVGTAVYIIGLMASYMYKFSQYEAVNLASFPRYMTIIISALAVCAYCVFAYGDIERKYIVLMGAFIVLSLFGNRYYACIVQRYYPVLAQTEISPYQQNIENVNNARDDKSKIWLVSCGDNGYKMQIYSYYVYPNYIPSYVSYSFTTGSSPLYDGDIWTKTNYTCEDFVNDFISGEYDILFLENADERFINEYGEVFALKEDILSGGIYGLDENSGKFVKIQ